jgi:hypothetical protein
MDTAKDTMVDNSMDMMIKDYATKDNGRGASGSSDDVNDTVTGLKTNEKEFHSVTTKLMGLGISTAHDDNTISIGADSDGMTGFALSLLYTISSL